MSGHSHWAGIKHRKGINDAKRGKIFTQHGKMITICAKSGGGNPEMNFQLRLAIERAKRDNMPKENIDRAIKRGTGELKGEEISEIMYEAMGSASGVMMLIQTATDNKNRTVSEVKSILTKAGGKMGEMGSALWNFEQVGLVVLNAEGKNQEDLEMLAIEAGAEDVKFEEDAMLVFVSSEKLPLTEEAMRKNNLEILSSKLSYLPKNTVKLDETSRATHEKLLETLEEQEDVEEIWDNVA